MSSLLFFSFFLLSPPLPSAFRNVLNLSAKLLLLSSMFFSVLFGATNTAHRSHDCPEPTMQSTVYVPYLGTIPTNFGPEGGLRKMVLIATSLVKAYYIMCLVIIYLINDHEAHAIVSFNK